MGKEQPDYVKVLDAVIKRLERRLDKNMSLEQGFSDWYLGAIRLRHEVGVFQNPAVVSDAVLQESQQAAPDRGE